MSSYFKFSNTVNPKHQLLMNKSIILNYLRENPFISRASISKNLGISAPTVSKIIDELISGGFIIELGKGESTGGKKPVKLGFNNENNNVIGVDLGKDRIVMALFDFSGKMIEKHVGFEIYYKDENLLEKIINEIKFFMKKILKNKGKIKDEKENIKAICISVPADIDSDNGVIISAPLFIKWNNLNLKEIFSKSFGVNIFIENSKNIYTIAEKSFEEYKNYKNFIMIEIGEGIGAGIIIDDQLYKGVSFSAGEIGFLISNKNNFYEPYNLKGFMEELASPSILSKEAIKSIREGEKSLIREIVKDNLNNISPSIVCKAAILGDELSKRIINNMVEYLAIIIANLILIINPEIIVIGGDIINLPNLNELFINPIIDLIKKVIPFRLPIIKTSKLGTDAGIIGCSMLAINKLLEDQYPYRI